MNYIRYNRIVVYLLGIAPYVFCISLMSFYVHAGNILDRPPHYNQPDPKELSIYKDYAPWIDVSAEIWFFAFITWIVMGVTYLVLTRKKIDVRPVAYTAIGHFLAIMLFFSGIFEWYID